MLPNTFCIKMWPAESSSKQLLTLRCVSLQVSPHPLFFFNPAPSLAPCARLPVSCLLTFMQFISIFFLFVLWVTFCFDFCFLWICVKMHVCCWVILISIIIINSQEYVFRSCHVCKKHECISVCRHADLSVFEPPVHVPLRRNQWEPKPPRILSPAQSITYQLSLITARPRGSTPASAIISSL